MTVTVEEAGDQAEIAPQPYTAFSYATVVLAACQVPMFELGTNAVENESITDVDAVETMRAVQLLAFDASVDAFCGPTGAAAAADTVGTTPCVTTFPRVCGFPIEI